MRVADELLLKSIIRSGKYPVNIYSTSQSFFFNWKPNSTMCQNVCLFVFFNTTT